MHASLRNKFLAQTTDDVGRNVITAGCTIGYEPGAAGSPRIGRKVLSLLERCLLSGAYTAPSVLVDPAEQHRKIQAEGFFSNDVNQSRHVFRVGLVTWNVQSLPITGGERAKRLCIRRNTVGISHRTLCFIAQRIY